MSSTALLPPSAQSALSTVTSSVARTAPSTPTAMKPVEAKPSPGTFRHPRLAEIVRRQNKTTLTQNDVRNAALNAGALVFSIAFGNIISSILSTPFWALSLSNDTAQDLTRLLLLVARLLFVVNIIVSLRQAVPYIARTDSMEDIPLTPSQRQLLGLPPSTKTLTPSGSPLAPSTGYITPPRYHRRLSGSSASQSSSGLLNNNNNSSTQHQQSDPISADRRSVSANYSASPLSTSRYTLGFSPSPTAPRTQPAYNRTTNSIGRTASGSPFSPSGSPLFLKAIDRQRRQSQDFDFGRSSTGGGMGLGRSSSVREGTTSERGSPLPRARKGVNFKWLYDQNYSFGNGPGTGTGRWLVGSQSMNF